MEDILQSAYNEYFGIDECDNKQDINDESNIFEDKVVTGVNKKYKKKSQEIGKDEFIDSSIYNDRLISKGHIHSVNDACDEIRKLLDIILGQGWGDFAPENSGHLDVNDIPVPSIRYSVNLREVSEDLGPKPKLIGTHKELANGIPTGDSFSIYKQRFDCIVEFNIRDTTSKGCATLTSKFEEIMAHYTGVLKERGLSEVYFLKEVPAKYSMYHTEAYAASTLYYYMRIEVTHVIKHSTLSDISLKMSIK